MLRLVERDEASPLSLEEIKAQLRVDDSASDGLLATYLAAAIDLVERETTQALQANVYEWRLDGWPCGTRTLQLPIAPVRDILTVTYIDAAGDEQSVDTVNWDWERSDTGADLWFSADFSFPTIGRERGGLRIGFEAGYDASEGTGSSGDPDLLLPSLAKPCLLLIIAHWFQNREDASDAALVEVPLGSKRLIQRLRIYR
jgi:uncharacterized phiE125 gp8 family phage protein